MPAFNRVAECLCRHPNSGVYYALVKRNGKQIRKSLKTPDCQLAEWRLADFRSKVDRNTNATKDRSTTFMELTVDSGRAELPDTKPIARWVTPEGRAMVGESRHEPVK